MPRKENESSIKKVYELWWKYLRLSKDYKKFCEWMREKSNNPNLPIPKRSNWFQLWDGYNFFGNIHTDSFEDWWECNKSKLRSREDGGFPTPIEDYTDFIMTDMEDVIQEFKRRNGEEPSLQEFMKGLLEKLKFPIPRFYFMVSIFGDYQDFEDIGKRFIKCLKEKKEKQAEIAKKRGEEYWRLLKKKLPFPFVEAQADKFATWAGRWRYPTSYSTSRLRLDEVERYLKVFNYFAEGLTWRQIAAKVYREKRYRDTRGKPEFNDSVKRAVYQDRENAEKIIRNAEQGIFPGQYWSRPNHENQKLSFR